MKSPLSMLALLIAGAGLLPAPLAAQWTNRYPRVEGYGHHVYLEGYELPSLTVGPLDAAPSPDGGMIAYASRGWLWTLDPVTSEARRITRTGDMDSRPAWSPDGRRLAFVRDDTRDTRIVLRELDTGRERVVVDEPALDLDPAFSPDGRELYYSSAAAGDLDLWRIDLETGEKTRLTDHRGLELRPQPHPDGRHVVYLAKGRGPNEVRIRSLDDGEERTLVSGRILSQTRPALSPDGGTIAYNVPTQDGWELRLVATAAPSSTVRLVGGGGRLPLTPAWSADGATVYFSEADDEERIVLRRVPAAGGAAVRVPVRSRDWSAPTARVRIRTRIAGDPGYSPARLAIVDGDGHPAVPDVGAPRFDGQTGAVYSYSPGIVDVTVPAGSVTVAAVAGLTTPVRTVSRTVGPGETEDVLIELERVHDPRADGWVSGDHHFHLNYGGLYRLSPEDLVLPARAEELDVLTPLLANLHDRFEDQHLWSWRRTAAPPIIRFGQEVRSHFLGHVGLVGIDDLFWPWIWGPGYQVYGRDDRANAEPLRHARGQGGVSAYVHPVSGRDPFAAEDPASVPLELIPDALAGELDALEVACLWSDERGTAELWHRLLNLGLPVVPSAGTDVMTDFFRTMAIGTTRVYVHLDGPLNLDAYLRALRAGRSFVTTGPLLDLRVDGMRPGDAVPVSGGEAEWSLALRTAVPVERVEVLVNGEVAWTGAGVEETGERRYGGRLTLPSGGWIAARAVGGEATTWPAMDSYAYAHTSPVWIGERGSTEAAAERAAARDLLRVLTAAEERLVAGYGAAEIPDLRRRFAEARRELERRSGAATQ